MPIAHRRFANPLRFRISDSKPRSANASAPDTPRRTIHRQTRNKTPAKCLDRAGKFPEMDDLEPLPVECTVLRQLPHFPLFWGELYVASNQMLGKNWREFLLDKLQNDAFFG
jgi:hypothetical protein